MNTQSTIFKTFIGSLVLFFMMLAPGTGWGQISITSNGTAFTQNFDGIGSSATAALPSGWKVNSAADYSTGTTATTQAAGTSGAGILTGSSAGGTYNFANGVTASSTERAVGFLCTGSYTSPRNLFVQVTNNTGATINSLSITFDIEKYRSGTRAWNINFFSGTDGTAWTAQTSGDQAYASDASNTVIYNPPTAIAKTVTISGLSIANGSSYYLRWSYTGTGGSTNAQGLGFDNFSITSSGGATAPTVTTQAVTAIGTINATGNGNITVTGGANASDRGVCYDIYANPDPDLADLHTIETGSFGTGAFTAAISSLSAETRYKVVAYATNTTGTGYGPAVNFWTLSSEPATYSSTFTNSVISQTQIDLSFVAASTITNADGYIILVKSGSVPTGIPVDGTAYAAGNVIGDGNVAAIVTNSSVTSASISGLTAGTLYYFTIMPYNYNGANNETYNYKTDGTIPSTYGTTMAPLAATSEVSGPALGSQPNPVLISSLVTTDAAAIRVFDMDVYDYGVDGQPTKITQVTIKPGSNNTANWANTIQGVKLSTDGGSTFVTTGTPVITSTFILFPITSGNLNVPDNSAITLSLYIYLKSTGLTDNQVLEFSVVSAPSSHVWLADGTGSTFMPTFASAPVSNQMLIDVVATKLNFVQQPSNAAPNSVMLPAVTVEAIDANNNRDLDYSTAITITSSGTLSGTPVTGTLSGGLATFSTLIHTANGSNLVLTAASGSLASATSNTFSISSLLLVENFSYTAPSLLTSNGWTAHSGTTNFIMVAASSIAYPGYLSSGIGNEVTLTTTGEDDNKAFASQNTGSLYASFIVNVTSSQTAGDYIAHFGATSGTSVTTFAGRVWIKKDASSTNFAFGLSSKTSTSVNYTGFTYTPGTTYLVVVKYNFISGATNDVSNLYINPVLHSTEPSPTISTTATDNAAADPAQLTSYCLRQGNAANAPAVKLDGIRVATTWTDIVGEYTVFTGTGNWSAVGNWSNGVPTISDYAIIDGDVTVDVDAATFDLTINAGRSVTISETKSLTVNGTLSNSAGNSGLVIKSGATGTGSLIHNTTGVPAKVERYFTGASTAWHLLSSPVASQAINPAFTDPTPANYDFYCWYEPAVTWVNFKNSTTSPTWNDANGSNDFTVGKGYLVEYMGTGVTKQFTGTLNNGVVSYDLTNSGTGLFAAYNLVGNPFASAIDWKAVSGWSRSFVELNSGGYDMSIWNDAVGNYGSFNSAGASGTNGVTQYIPVGQGFMVKATSAGAFGMDNSVRVHNNQPYLKSTEEITNILRMKVSGNLNTYSDEIVVEFGHQDATGGAEKMFGFYETSPGLYTVKATGNYSVDFRGEPGAVVIPVSFKAGVDGDYTLTASQIESFTSTTQITLEDVKTARTQNLMQNPDYTFTAGKNDEEARFLLHFGGTFGLNDKENQPVIIYSSGSSVYISDKSGAILKGEVTVYNMIGQPVMSSHLSENPLTKINLSGSTGYYLIQVVTGKNAYSGKVFIN